MRAIVGGFALALVAVLTWVLVAPQQMGGSLAAVSTYGQSMTPIYAPHDLVFVRRTSSYSVGDVVAYRSGSLDTVVLHRIVKIEGTTFITSGDANAWNDPDRPDEQDLIGRAWMRIPHVGRLLQLPLGLRIAVPILVAGGLTRLRSPRRKSNTTKRWIRRPRGAPIMDPRKPAWVPAVAAAVLLAGILLAATAWSRPATSPGAVDYTQEATFSYRADVPEAPIVYSDGTVDTGEPIFLLLRDRIDITVDWTFESGPTAELRGTGQLMAHVQDASGWSRSLPLGPETDFAGTSARLSGELDFAAVRRMAATAARSTGVDSGSQTVEVTGELSTEGHVAGAPWTSEFSPVMTFRLDELRAVPDLPEDAGPSGDDPATTEVGTVTAPDVGTTRLALAGHELGVPTVRVASATLVALGLLGLAASFVAHRRNDRDEDERIQARYGSGIIDTLSLSAAGNRSRVTVKAFAQLADVAEYRQLPILRVPIRAGGHGYVVDDSTARYSYVASAHRTHTPDQAEPAGSC